ncbi:Dihydrolipoyl dehydrogenase [Candidatus Magnetomoraceae bacterium gMMP-1]
MNKLDYDIIIIGSGPGGYTAAIRASQLGMKTACIEKEKNLGGVCLNVGCIPSKALLDSSEYYYLAKKRFAKHGIETDQLKLNMSIMMTRKEKVIEGLTKDLRKLLERSKIYIIHGTAKFKNKNQVEIISNDNSNKILTSKAIILATGSIPVSVPNLEFDSKYIVSSTEALSFKSVPEHLCIVGGGFIGLELGSVWSRLGSKVTVIEMLPKIAANLDGQVSRTMERILKKQGLSFRLKTKISSAAISNKKLKLNLDSEGKQDIIECDKLLVAVGRKPLTHGLGLKKSGIKTDSSTGCIIVNENYCTNISNIYAIGDLISGPMLAHKASAEGIAAVEYIVKKLSGKINYNAIPSAIYTSPEVGCVGLTEEQVKDRNIPFSTSTFPFRGLGRARCMGETDGFVKLIVHSKTDRILGIHIIGPRASDIIAECTLAIKLNTTVKDIAQTIHAHPSFSEILQEAANKILLH